MNDFTPPTVFNVRDRHNGFTAVVHNDTLWRPAACLDNGTTGTLVDGSVKHDDFWQNTRPVISACYTLPGYPHKVKIWWTRVGERLA